MLNIIKNLLIIGSFDYIYAPNNIGEIESFMKELYGGAVHTFDVKFRDIYELEVEHNNFSIILKTKHNISADWNKNRVDAKFYSFFNININEGLAVMKLNIAYPHNGEVRQSLNNRVNIDTLEVWKK